MARIILITGGARSGKSNYAQERAESMAGSRSYVATCPGPDAMADSELQDRIDRHQQDRREKGWATVEEQTDIRGAIDRFYEREVLLIDCLTLWINNLLHRADGNLNEDDIVQHCEQLIDSCRSHPGTILLVTNEVGLGVVPEYSLGRRFRDLLGRCNQVVAAAAHEVVLVTCGIPLTIKNVNHDMND